MQILFEDMLYATVACWRRLDVADPLGRVQLANQRFPRLAVLQVREISVQRQLVSLAEPIEPVEKVFAITAAQRNRIDEVRSGDNSSYPGAVSLNSGGGCLKTIDTFRPP